MSFVELRKEARWYQFYEYIAKHAHNNAKCDCPYECECPCSDCQEDEYRRMMEDVRGY